VYEHEKNGFTLIELLVVIVIMGILSSLGVVGYNAYVDSSNDAATKNNYNKITKVLESEFAKCKLNKNSKILDNHSCASAPNILQLEDYFTNTQKLKNSYNQNNKVIQSDICTPGGVTIKTTDSGVYETAYFSQKNNTKSSSIINSSWSKKFADTTSSTVSFSCVQTASVPATTPVSTTPIGSFATYSVPANCPSKNCLGAYIKVDKDGKMTGDFGGGAVMEKDVAQSWSNAEYKWVLVNPADATGNVYSACANRACSYNFSNNSYNVGSVVYDPLTGKPK
jgi:prepilin-type N-terminal cleavage/methylation domain-containing protein